MTKQELFLKYNIDETHSEWDNQIDNWMGVEIYRIMHGGNLPPQNDKSVKWILDFLDKKNTDFKWWIKNVMNRPDWGSLFLTAKRLAYSLSEQIIADSN